MNSKLAWLIGAGLSGSIIGLSIHKEITTPGQKFMFIFGGLACTVFGAGPLAHHFGITDPGDVAGVGFGVAIFWQLIVAKFGGFISNFSLPFGGKE